jgi:hypothetical protein
MDRFCNVVSMAVFQYACRQYVGVIKYLNILVGNFPPSRSFRHRPAFSDGLVRVRH